MSRNAGLQGHLLANIHRQRNATTMGSMAGIMAAMRVDILKGTRNRVRICLRARWLPNKSAGDIPCVPGNPCKGAPDMRRWTIGNPHVSCLRFVIKGRKNAENMVGQWHREQWADNMLH